MATKKKTFTKDTLKPAPKPPFKILEEKAACSEYVNEYAWVASWTSFAAPGYPTNKVIFHDKRSMCDFILKENIRECRFDFTNNY